MFAAISCPVKTAQPIFSHSAVLIEPNWWINLSEILITSMCWWPAKMTSHDGLLSEMMRYLSSRQRVLLSLGTGTRTSRQPGFHSSLPSLWQSVTTLTARKPSSIPHFEVLLWPMRKFLLVLLRNFSYGVYFVAIQTGWLILSPLVILIEKYSKLIMV